MLGVASLVTLLFQRIRQPVVLGYLVAGMLIGPFTPPYDLITQSSEVTVISELGVIFLMFSLGLDFSFHKLTRVGFSGSITGLIEVSLTVCAGILTGLALHWSFYESLFLGAALSISSTTIIIKALDELNLRRKRFAEYIFGILVMEDLLAILLLVGLSTFVATKNFLSVNMLFAVIQLIFVVGGWFLIGYFLVPSFLRGITRYAGEETLTIVSVALCLILVTIATRFGYSPALGAFIMGSIFAETPVSHRIEELIRPVRDIFAAVFFVSVGMLIDPRVIWMSFPTILLITGIYITAKVGSTVMGALITGQSVGTSVRIGFGVAQIGEFSFIIAGLGAALHVTSDRLYPMVVAISVMTTFTTPYLLRFSGFLSQRLEHWLPENVRHFLNDYAAWVYRVLARPENPAVSRNAGMRLVLNGIVIAIVFSLVQHLLLPVYYGWVHRQWVGRLIAWLSALLVASPFIWGMLFSVNVAPHRRGKDRIFHMAPVIMCWLATVIEITVLSVTWFHNWLTTSLLLVIVVAFFIFSFRMLDRSYHWFERRLVRNVSHNAGLQARYRQLAPWETHFSEVVVSAGSPLAGRTLTQCQLRELYGINIVALYSPGKVILAPRGEARISGHDRLVVLGSDDQIDAFQKVATQVSREMKNADESDTLNNFSLKAMVLPADSPFVGKSIRKSGIREKVNGIVVGLEREDKRTLNPDPSTVLHAGDLVMLVGEMEQLHNVF